MYNTRNRLLQTKSNIY